MKKGEGKKMYNERTRQRGSASLLRRILETVIAIVILVLTLVYVFKTYDQRTVIEWMRLPFTYGGNSEPLSVNVIEKNVEGTKLTVVFDIRNNTDEDIEIFNLLAVHDGKIEEFKVKDTEGYARKAIPAKQSRTYWIRYGSGKTSSNEVDKLVGSDEFSSLAEEDYSDWVFHVSSYRTTSYKEIKGTTPWKYIILIALCITCVILAVKRVSDNFIIMTLIKVFAVPLFIVLLFASLNTTVDLSPSLASEARRKKQEAASRYRAAATQKANAERIGYKNGVIDQQVAMDRAMADILSADADVNTERGKAALKAAQEYRSAAVYKGNADRNNYKQGSIEGQLAKDKAMADLLAKK